MFFRRAIAGLLAAALTLGGLSLAAKPALAAPGEQDYQAAARLLNKYKLVQGDDRGYRFYDPIKRSEVAKVIIHALGYEDQAAQYVGRGDFTDTRGHWAEGYIALAKDLGYINGYREGDFRPDNYVSYAEAVTILARLVGLESSGEPWPDTYVQPARDAGIIPADMDLRGKLNSPAIRGDVFVMVKRTMVDVKNFAGDNLLKLYLDQSPPALTLDTLPNETRYSRVTVTGKAGDAEVIKIGETEYPVNADGSFAADVPLKLGANTLRVRAVDAAGNYKESTVQLTRLAAPAAAIDLTGPQQVTVGQSVKFTLTVRDENGSVDQNPANLQVQVTPNMGSFDPFSGRFTAGTKAGTATITVRSGAVEVSRSVAIVPGELDHMGITPEETELSPGASVTFMAKGYDAYNNEVPFNGLPTWTASDGSIDSSGKFQAPAEFTRDITVTAQWGVQTAQAKVLPPNSKVASVYVTNPTSVLRASGRGETTLTATVVDAFGRPVTDYKGTLSVTTSAPNVAAPVLSTVTVVDGVAQIPVRSGTTAGIAQIKVATNLGKSGTANVTVQPQQLQSVRLTGSATPSRADGTVLGTIDAVALDQDGNPMVTALNAPLVVTLSIAGDAGALFVSNGRATADIALQAVDSTGAVHTQTSVTYPSDTSALMITGTVRTPNYAFVQVIPGALSGNVIGMPNQLRVEPVAELIAGNTRRVYVNVVDSDGYRVTQPGPLAGVSVQLRDKEGVLIPLAGALEGRYWFDVAPTKAGTAVYTAMLQPGGYTTSVNVPVVAGNLDHLVLSATPAILQADNAQQTVLRAELVDRYGNRLTYGTYPVTFTRAADNGVTQPYVWSNQTVNSSGGVAELRVTAGTVVGTVDFGAHTTIPASLGGGTLNAQAPATVSTQGSPFRLALSYGDNDGDNTLGGPMDHLGVAGQPFAVVVKVLDQVSGSVVTYDSGRQIKLTARRNNGSQQIFTATTQNGQAVFYVPLAQDGTYGFKAEADGLGSAFTQSFSGTLVDAQMRARLNLALQVVPDLTTILADDGVSYSEIKVDLMDGSGRVTTNKTGQPLNITLTIQPDPMTGASGFFTADGGSRITTRTVAVSPGASSSEPVALYSLGAAGRITVKATLSDGTSHSAQVTAVLRGAPARLVVSPMAVSALESWNADSLVTGQEVTVTAYDNLNQRLTDENGNLTVNTLAANPAGDVVVVSYYDPSVRAWRSLDPALNDNGNNLYPTNVSVPFDRGQAQFRVRSNTPGVKESQLSAPGLGSTSAYGQFQGVAPDRLVISPPQTLKGANSQAAITVKVVDSTGAVLPYVTGQIQFVLTRASGTGAKLLANSVTLQNGEATVYLQSGPRQAWGDEVLTVQAVSSTLKRANGQMLSSVSTNVSIDYGAILTSARISNGGGGASGAVNAGDTLQFNFSQELKSGVAPLGLTKGGPAQPVSVVFTEATDTVAVRVGGLDLFTIKMAPNSVSQDQTLSAEIKLDSTGRVVTVTLTAPGTVTVANQIQPVQVVVDDLLLDATDIPAGGSFPFTVGTF